MLLPPFLLSSPSSSEQRAPQRPSPGGGQMVWDSPENGKSIPKNVASSKLSAAQKSHVSRPVGQSRTLCWMEERREEGSLTPFSPSFLFLQTRGRERGGEEGRNSSSPVVRRKHFKDPPTHFPTHFPFFAVLASSRSASGFLERSHGANQEQKTK